MHNIPVFNVAMIDICAEKSRSMVREGIVARRASASIIDIFAPALKEAHVCPQVHRLILKLRAKLEPCSPFTQFCPYFPVNRPLLNAPCYHYFCPITRLLINRIIIWLLDCNPVFRTKMTISLHPKNRARGSCRTSGVINGELLS